MIDKLSLDEKFNRMDFIAGDLSADFKELINKLNASIDAINSALLRLDKTDIDIEDLKLNKVDK